MSEGDGAFAGMPDEYKCPITCEMMRDPVFAADGHTYERRAIATWFETKQTSPLSNAVLEHRRLVPNRALKQLIDKWRGRINAELLALAASGAPASGTVALEALLDKGADVETRDTEGNTPVMLLLQRDNIGAVRCLVRAGASLLVRNDAGLTALDMAQRKSPRDPAVVTLVARLEREEREKKQRDDDCKARARAREQQSYYGNGGGNDGGNVNGDRGGFGRWFNNVNFNFPNVGGGIFLFGFGGGGFGWLSLLMLLPMFPMLWRFVQGQQGAAGGFGASLTKLQRGALAAALLAVFIWYSLTAGGSHANTFGRSFTRTLF